LNTFARRLLDVCSIV